MESCDLSKSVLSSFLSDMLSSDGAGAEGEWATEVNRWELRGADKQIVKLDIGVRSSNNTASKRVSPSNEKGEADDDVSCFLPDTSFWHCVIEPLFI